LACLQTANADEYDKWKTTPPFEISGIDGFQDNYNVGDPIHISITGKSNKINTDPLNGFGIAATIYDIPRKKGFQGAAGTYDQGKHAWNVELTAPTDTTLSYEIEIHLYCSKNVSPCADTYGIAAQVEKKIPLKIEEAQEPHTEE